MPGCGRRLPTHPARDIGVLLPHRWAPYVIQAKGFPKVLGGNLSQWLTKAKGSDGALLRIGRDGPLSRRPAAFGATSLC